MVHSFVVAGDETQSLVHVRKELDPALRTLYLAALPQILNVTIYSLYRFPLLDISL